MSLEIFWFCLIAVLWAGYFVLEGFDFGVGMLLAPLARGERDRRTLIESIGPVWDGNEVWLVVAAGGTFAAFPAWYATMFSAFYIALLAILVCLIVRAVSFEWRARSRSATARACGTWAIVAASVGAPFLWGVALANLVNGIPLNGSGDFSGNVLDLLSPYTVFAGVATVLLFALHGATFLSLRTTGDLHARAVAAARQLCIPAALTAMAFLDWTVGVAIDHNDKDLFPPILPAALGTTALVFAVVFVLVRRAGLAFLMTALGSALTVATIFTGLYPRVLVSHPDVANSLTISSAASAHYALSVITVVAAIFTPVVLLYQGWTYHVFRARLSGEQPAPPPAEALARKAG
jgi:cytochrome bd ubiquinol oxidase subunit II